MVQLICYCDAKAKQVILQLDETVLPVQKAFPLELLCIFVNGEKMTLDTGQSIRFEAHRQLAKEFFQNNKILFADEFDLVAWSHVHRTLTTEVPILFQLWACKQVMGVAATNKVLHYRDTSHCPLCPCCTVAEETAAHMLSCNEAGRVEALHVTADCLEDWMEDNDTDPDLAKCIGEYVRE